MTTVVNFTGKSVIVLCESKGITSFSGQNVAHAIHACCMHFMGNSHDLLNMHVVSVIVHVS